ncbi:unnamed protein product [Chironomus riparius]|uniref:Uncharacterized protein n=1 Tax=Chironomus riparius TaxID=315576 RepID=A0A9N9WQE5_9DIPT|nr:unnamed protein product [Chironomus riparius]
MKGFGEKSNVDIVCGHADRLFERCFANSEDFNASKIFFQNTTKRKIPYSTVEIDYNCKLFNRGLQCYHDYTEKCMDAMNKRLINGEVEPAKNFYSMLCNDKEFKKDYLNHRECFRYIEKDFEECTAHYQNVIENEFKRIEREKKSNINVQYMQFCCARYSYENCVYNSAWSKCNAKSAKFTKSIVELLSSERQFKNCAKIEKTLCSDASGSFHGFNMIMYLLCSSSILSGMLLIRQL